MGFGLGLDVTHIQSHPVPSELNGFRPTVCLSQTAPLWKWALDVTNQY